MFIDITANQAIVTASITGSVTLIVGMITAFVAMRTNALSRGNERKLEVLKVLLDAAYKNMS